MSASTYPLWLTTVDLLSNQSELLIRSIPVPYCPSFSKWFSLVPSPSFPSDGHTILLSSVQLSATVPICPASPSFSCASVSLSILILSFSVPLEEGSKFCIARGLILVIYLFHLFLFLSIPALALIQSLSFPKRYDLPSIFSTWTPPTLSFSSTPTVICQFPSDFFVTLEWNPDFSCGWLHFRGTALRQFWWKPWESTKEYLGRKNRGNFVG